MSTLSESDARLDPESIVNVFYHVWLGREPDPAGRAYYVRALNEGGMSASELAEAFQASDEYLNSASRRLVRVVSNDCIFLLPANAPVAHELASPEGYEPWVLPYFLERCHAGMNVLDIGASWGAFALPAARRVGPGGRVYALEVSPANCRVLLRCARASGISNLEILPFGVSDRFGSELLRRQQSTANNNSIQSGATPDADLLEGFDVVPVFPLDLIRSALQPVQLVKMDIEGMEYRAVVGALAFLREHRPIVFCEYSPAFQRHGSGVDGADLLKQFFELGYQAEILHRHRPREPVYAGDAGEQIATIDAAWRRHVGEDQGTHLDLCLAPIPPGGAA